MVRRVQLGRVGYGEALELQRGLAGAMKEGALDDDLLLLLEHDPVVTLGRGAADSNLGSPELLAARGVPLVEIERGGDVTYHGPGQLVGYPIFDLHRHRRDLHWYLRALEKSLIAALGELELPACRVGGYTGVWCGSAEDVSVEAASPLVASGAVRKVASIGVHVSRWVTWHGFALNVTDEPLDNFRLIVPCGIPDVQMTSLRREGVELGGVTDDRLIEAVGSGFERVFGVTVEAADDVPPVADVLTPLDRNRAATAE